MRWRIGLLIPFVALAAVSCEEQPAAPGGDAAVAEAPAFNFMNNPKQGPVVYRDEYVVMVGEFYEETPTGESRVRVVSRSARPDHCAEHEHRQIGRIQ